MKIGRFLHCTSSHMPAPKATAAEQSSGTTCLTDKALPGAVGVVPGLLQRPSPSATKFKMLLVLEGGGAGVFPQDNEG